MKGEKKVILILSGGMDSTTLLYYLIDKNYCVEAVSFDYGQKHSKELKCAQKLCEMLRVEHSIIDLSILNFFLESSLTSEDREVPEGHYTEKSMKSTVVPHRNLLMLTIANAVGLSRKIRKVAYATHSGDHFIYPDCRPNFIASAKFVLQASMDDHSVDIITPFLRIDKTDILRIGLNLGVPYQQTWTCYKGKEKPCGKCGACVERLEAFEQAGSKDPLKY